MGLLKKKKPMSRRGAMSIPIISVPEPSKYRISIVWSYVIYGECVRSKIQSARKKTKLNKLSRSRLALCVNRVQKRLSEPLHARSRLGGGCLSIVRLSRHHSVVGRLLIHRSDPLTWPHATISVTLGALLSRLVRAIRERIWWYARVWAVGWPVFWALWDIPRDWDETSLDIGMRHPQRLRYDIIRYWDETSPEVEIRHH